MTSSGRYACARKILSKKATEIVFTIKRLLSNIDSSAVETRNKLFDALVKPVLLYGCELLSYKTHFDKSTIEQVQKVQLSKRFRRVSAITKIALTRRKRFKTA